MPAALFDLSGRVALITGSSQGIGLAIARALGAAGAVAVINGRNAARLAPAEESLAAAGCEVRSAAFDVTDPDAVRATVAQIEADIGPIEILVNNAGMQFRSPVEEFPLATWRDMFRLNAESVFIVSQAVGRGMIGRRRGKIINIASVQSELARSGIAPYAATKGALKMLTKGLCADWAKYGIQVNAIAPGYFRTELNQSLADDAEFSAWLEKRTPAGRWGEVDELAGAAVFLASDASSFVNGHVLFVDGGITASL